MASELGEAIRLLVQDRGISEDLIMKTIEDFLLAAYKRKFGSVDNAVIRFGENGNDVTIFSQKKIVEDVYDPLREISLEDALVFNDESEIDDELLIEINPKEFDRVSIQSAKQKARQTLRDIQKDYLHSEYKDKVGEMIIGYYQRERSGNIYVDLGKTEGLLPKRYQSPREVYHPGDRIKSLIYEVTKTESRLEIILSRTHTDFIKRVFELEVPEIYDKTVEIFKIVREPGYRTKIAVYSNREDVDPVGACVGVKGVRIQAIVRELEGEKIDILKYDTDPQVFIKNALSPAEVSHVIVLDEAKRQALAVVPENQLSLAIGKQGLNVRLANRLADWSIDVKTEAQFAEMDITAETKRAVSELFGEIEEEEAAVEEEEEITDISELPGIPEKVVEKLRQNGINLIEKLVSLSEEELHNLSDITDNEIETIKQIITENVEIIEQEGVSAEENVEVSKADVQTAERETEPEKEIAAGKEQYQEYEEETFECPECSAPITIDMTTCPNCGVGLSFEIEEEEEEDETSTSEE
jgi:transcription termination/antitermination protein NusA